jgi:hypothetical protein
MGQIRQIKMLVIGAMEIHTYDEPSTPPKIFYILFIQVICTMELRPTAWQQQILPGKTYLHPSGVARWRQKLQPAAASYHSMRSKVRSIHRRKAKGRDTSVYFLCSLQCYSMLRLKWVSSQIETISF